MMMITVYDDDDDDDDDVDDDDRDVPIKNIFDDASLEVWACVDKCANSHCGRGEGQREHLMVMMMAMMVIFRMMMTMM